MEEQLCHGCLALRRRVAELEAEQQRLLQLLDAERRSGKRQAAPFSKGPPKEKPKKPGRKPGEDYGTKAHRQPPEQIDETHEAPLPEACPDCGGPIEETAIQQQYQTEIPRQPIHRQFNIHIGWCPHCRKRFQGRHALQTSNALGAAAAQLGPDAQAALVELNKHAGLSQGKIVGVFRQLFGIDLSRGGSMQAILRAARKCQAVYDAIVHAVRHSPTAVPDETGWRVTGRSAWLHTVVGATATTYAIDPGRSGAVAERILGCDYDGTMIHDGWSPYDGFVDVAHQQCLQHLIRRCKDMLATATRGAVHFPRRVLRLLRQALALRDRHLNGEVSLHGLAIARSRLHNAMVGLVVPCKHNAANERLANHLHKHLGALFLFLYDPSLDATNYRAEQAMRFGVVLRKVWGGNRTWDGAQAQAILMSVGRTAWQRGWSALDFLSRLLRNRLRPLPLPP